jgi:hypothetical protein
MLVRELVADVAMGVVIPRHWVANTKPMYCYYLVGVVRRKHIDPAFGSHQPKSMPSDYFVAAAFVVDDESVMIDIEPWYIHSLVAGVAAVFVHWHSHKLFEVVAAGNYYYYSRTYYLLYVDAAFDG